MKEPDPSLDIPEFITLALKENVDSFIINYKIKDENLRTRIGQTWHGDISDVAGLNAIGQARILKWMTQNKNFTDE